MREPMTRARSSRSGSGPVAAAPTRRPSSPAAPAAPPAPPAVRRRRLPHRPRRRTGLALTALVAALALAAVLLSGQGAAGPPLTAVRARIVSVAESQLGYRTDPAHSYCNVYSAYWGQGSACGHGLRAEEWCADFAAWVWHHAGVQFTYGFATGDVDSGAASFYTWAVAHGTWHPAGSGYQPRPGDVAVYGLDTATDVADHVAVVTSFTPRQRGPDVVNGDGDRTGYSVVETGTDQYKADAPGGAALLSGYASPIVPRAAA